MSPEAIGEPNQAADMRDPAETLEKFTEFMSRFPVMYQDPATGEFTMYHFNPLEETLGRAAYALSDQTETSESDMQKAQDFVDDLGFLLSPHETDPGFEVDPDTPVGAYMLRKAESIKDLDLDEINANASNLIRNNLGNLVSRAALLDGAIRAFRITPEGFSAPKRRRGRLERYARLFDDDIDIYFRSNYNLLVRTSELEFKSSEQKYYDRIVRKNELGISRYNFEGVLRQLGIQADRASAAVPETADRGALATINKIGAVAIADYALHVINDSRVDKQAVVNAYVVRCLQRLNELKESIPPTPITLDDEARRHILRGDELGGGHHLPSLDPDLVTLVSNRWELENSTHPVHKTQYGVTRNSATGRMRLNTFFPSHWTPEKILSAIEQPKKTLFKREAGGVIEHYVMYDGLTIIRYHDPQTGRCYTARPVLLEVTDAPVKSLKKAAGLLRAPRTDRE